MARFSPAGLPSSTVGAGPSFTLSGSFKYSSLIQTARLGSEPRLRARPTPLTYSDEARLRGPVCRWCGVPRPYSSFLCFVMCYSLIAGPCSRVGHPHQPLRPDVPVPMAVLRQQQRDVGVRSIWSMFRQRLRGDGHLQPHVPVQHLRAVALPVPAHVESDVSVRRGCAGMMHIVLM